MAGEVEAGGLLLHGHHLLPGELGDGLHPELRRLLLPAAPAAEQVKLSLQILPHVLGDGVHQGLIGPQQLGAVQPHAVKGAALDEVLQHPLVQIRPAHALAEVREGGEGPSLPPFLQHIVDKTPAHPLDGHQAEADVFAGDGEVGLRLVDVGGQQGDAAVLALGDILGHLLAGVQHGGEQGGHVLPGVVALEPGRLVGYDGVGHGVGLVEGVLSESLDLVVDVLGGLLRDAVGGAPGDAPLRIPIDKGLPLLLDLSLLLFGNGPAHHVRLSHGVPRQPAEDLDDLLLVDDAAVGDGQNGLQQGVLVLHLVRVVLTGDEPGDGVHGAGAVEGDDGGDVLDILGLEAHAHAGHARRLHLEHAGGPAVGEHLEHLRVVVRDVRQGEAGAGFLHQLHGVVQDGQVAQAQEVHLQQAQLLQGGHDVLGDHRLVVLGQRHIVHHRPPGDHHPGGVGGGVAGHPLNGLGGVDEAVNPLVPLVQLPQGLGQLEGLVQGDVEVARAAGHLLGHRVHLGIGDVQGPAHVPDGRPGRHGPEGDDLGYVVGAVLVLDVLHDLLPPADAEVDVNVRHGNPLRVQKPLKVEGVLHGVHVGDGQAVGHHAPGGGAPAGAHRDALPLGIADEVRDDEEVVHKPHLPDNPHLIVQPLPVALGMVGVAAGKALLAQLLEVGVPVGVPLRQFELRQVVDAELEVHAAQLGDLPRVLQGLGVVGEQLGHLLGGLDVELAGLHPQAVGVVHRLAHLDAHEGVLHLRVLPAEVVGVVGHHQGDAGLLVDADKPLVDHRVVGQVVVLQLQVVAVLPEQLPHLQGGGLGPLVVARQDQPGHLPGLAGRQGDEPRRVLPQQLLVDAGLDVKPLGEGGGVQAAQVAVALLIAAQEDQVIHGGVHPVDPVGAAAGGHVHLAADDGLDPLRLTGLVEVHHAVHGPVVGDGHSGLPQLLHPLHQQGDAAGPVQQGVFGVYVQMDKGHGDASSFSIGSGCRR